MTKTELQAITRAGGLQVEGEESIAELSEALIHLVQARKIHATPTGIRRWTPRDIAALDEALDAAEAAWLETA